MQQGQGHSPSNQSKNRLPPLAPRGSHASSSSSRDRPTASGSGRPPRLSHRSRAGCWTCRGRKVKCDEGRPRCGPCTRLNRECDWEHRWNFSDATPGTQDKYANVTTAGNAIWDPSARPSSSPSPSRQQQDDLPVFASLTNDEDRERKAESQRPGTFGVVVTPESFSDMPEYAAASSPVGRRMSAQSQSSRRGSLASTLSSFNRSISLTDPNTVVLERFEETASSSARVSPPTKGQSLSGSLDRLSISPPAASLQHTPRVVAAMQGSERSQQQDVHLVQHFRHYIVHRLVQPLIDQQVQDTPTPGATQDIFEIEAANFRPLHHAICALSALHLSYTGRLPLEEAMQHYHRALSTSATIATSDDLLSDGVFLRHFLLLIYDICVPMAAEAGGADMWADHLKNLRHLAVQRYERLGQEPFPYIIWAICELDVRACLLGNGTCEFIRAILSRDMLPALDRQIPLPGPLGPFLPGEANFFPTILNLNQGVVIHTGKLAQLSQTLRADAAARSTPLSSETIALWSATVSQVRNELISFWMHHCPDHLAQEATSGHRAVLKLPDRVRFIYDQAFMLYHAAIIYSRTSMYPQQRPSPQFQQPFTSSSSALTHQSDTETRCQLIIQLAATHLSTNQADRRNDIFPLFIAGVATASADSKVHAIDLAKTFEAQGGLGQNTHRTRQLLVAVCEEQRRVVGAGGRVEDVDWLEVARERGLGVVNCGL